MKNLIGNTPLIAIKYKYQNKEKIIYAKLENYNLTGSIKDRIVYNILSKKNLKENQPIIEATSGNTGIALAAYGAYYNHPVYIFMPDWSSKERIDLMELYGAKVTLVSKETGGFKGCIEKAKMLAQELNGYLFNQFSDQENVQTHYETTGPEIVRQLPKIGGFVSGIGTGGTFTGIAKCLKEYNPKIKTYALEPENIPILSGGKIMGPHKISGIGDDFIPEIVETSFIDKVLTVSDEIAIEMARKLASELGLAVGISSGANIYAAIKMSEEVDCVLTIIVDDAKKYLSTDLIKKNKAKILPEIELLSYESVN